MTLEKLLILGALVFCIGLYGVLTRRNIIGILISVELLLNAVNINLIGFARYGSSDPTSAHVFAVFIIALAAAEMAVALAIIITMYRQRKIMDVHQLEDLQG
jgi:NADH:ubiquinone oxidoreductase subunit K